MNGAILENYVPACAESKGFIHVGTEKYDFYPFTCGGVEKGEDLQNAIKRERKEELGIEVDGICKIGAVSDYDNLIDRHNLNN